MENQAVQVVEEKPARKKNAKSRAAKRKVGRPKKVVKRPVGRPRKDSLPQAKKRGRPRKVDQVSTNVMDTMIEKQLSHATKKIVKDFKNRLPEQYLQEMEADYVLQLDVLEKFDETKKDLKTNYLDTVEEIKDTTKKVSSQVEKELNHIAKSFPVEINRSKKMQKEENKVARDALQERYKAYQLDVEKLTQEHATNQKAIESEKKALEALYQKNLDEEKAMYLQIVKNLEEQEKSIHKEQEEKLKKMEDVFHHTIEKKNKALEKLNTNYQKQVDKLQAEFQEQVIAIDHKRASRTHDMNEEMTVLEHKLDQASTKEEIKQIKKDSKQSVIQFDLDSKNMDQEKLDLSYALEDTLSNMRKELIDACVQLEKEKEQVVIQFQTDKELYYDIMQKENNDLTLEKEKQKQKHEYRLMEIKTKHYDAMSEQTVLQKKLEFQNELDSIYQSVMYQVAEEQAKKQYAVAKLEHEQRLKNLVYEIEIDTRKQNFIQEKRTLEDAFHQKLAHDRYVGDLYGAVAKKTNVDLLLLYRGQIRLKQLMHSRTLSMEEDWVNVLDKQKEQLEKIKTNRILALEQEIKENLYAINQTYFAVIEELKSYQVSIDQADTEGQKHIAHQISFLQELHQKERDDYKKMYQDMKQQIEQMYTSGLELIETQRQNVLCIAKECMDHIDQYMEEKGGLVNQTIEQINQSIDTRKAITDQNKQYSREVYDVNLDKKERILSYQSVQCAIEANNYNYEQQKQNVLQEHESKIGNLMNMYHQAKKQAEEGKTKAEFVQKSTLQDMKYQLYAKKLDMDSILQTMEETHTAAEQDRLYTANMKKHELDDQLNKLEKKYARKQKYLQKKAVINTKIEWWTDEYEG